MASNSSTPPKVVPATARVNDYAPAPEAVDVNYRFFVDFVLGLPRARELRVLDYGCGRGDTVALLKSRNVQCFGVDSFTHPHSLSARSSPLFNEKVLRPLERDGRIPFPDGYFDVVLSNQVLEHVKDKPAVAREFRRVLKRDGVMRHHFPSREVIREGHLGIPFVHWFAPGRVRWWYAYCLRRVGLGDDWGISSAGEWADTVTRYLDEYCSYDPYRRIREIFAADFVLAHREMEYIGYRVGGRGLLSTLTSIRLLEPLYEYVFRRLGFMVLEMRPHRASLGS